MIEKKGYDYDAVRVVVDNKYVSFDNEEVEPDLSFKLGKLVGKLPIVLYYEADEGGHRGMEKACADNGIITAGAVGTDIPLPIDKIQELTFAPQPVGFRLFESFAPTSLENRKAMGQMILDGNALVVGCSVSAEHARAVANELKLASAILVGPTQAQTTKRLEATGVSVPRVSLIEEISYSVDVPVIATASSPADVCKALVAGADAVLIHFGYPEENDNLDFAVKAVADSLRETLTELCQACGAKDIRALSTRCKLTPA